ncbi:MAG TPA: helix-turn-helix transcriptional regulator [Thermoanaerobaculia bacterium]|jgi:AraC-like DNA-binding protein
MTCGRRPRFRRYHSSVMRGVSKLEVARYVRECLAREDVPRVSELAAIHGMTPEYVSRAFRDRFGLRISEYMKSIQVRVAQRLLRNTDLNTTRIAYRCGFGTRRSFFRTYRRVAGQSPAEHGRR